MFFVHIHSMTNHIQLVNVDPVWPEETEILVGNSVIIAKSLNLYIIIFNTYSVFCFKKGDIWKLLLGWLYSLNTSRYIYVYFETLLFIALTRWQLWKQCFWKRWMNRISVWTWRHWGRDGEACKPPSPTGPGSRLARPRGRKEAGSSLAVRSRSCWHQAPCESPAWYHKAPWSWWSSYSKWIWGSGVYCLYFPLFDPQVHGDWGEKKTRKVKFQCCRFWLKRFQRFNSHFDSSKKIHLFILWYSKWVKAADRKTKPDIHSQDLKE